MNPTVQFLEEQLQLVSCEEFVINQTFFAEVRNLLEMYRRCLVGGNHAATALHVLAPTVDWAALPSHEAALQTLGAGAAYEMWCCWRAIHHGGGGNANRNRNTGRAAEGQ